MSLSVSHGCWSDSAGAFSFWRNELARIAGYEIVPSRSKTSAGETYGVAYADKWTAENFYGDWEPGQPEGDPLLVLLIHSDQEGRIAWRHQLPLASRLEELLPAMEASDAAADRFYSYAEMQRRFIKGLRDANAAAEDVRFS